MMWFITLIRLEIVSFFSCFSSSSWQNNILEGIIADFHFPHHFFLCVFYLFAFFVTVVCLETTNEMKNWNYEELSLKFWGCGKWTKDLKSLPQIQKVYSSPYSTTILHSTQKSNIHEKCGIKQNRQFSCEVEKSQEKLTKEVGKMYIIFCRWKNRNVVKFSFTQMSLLYFY